MRTGGVANTMTPIHTVSMSANKKRINAHKWMNFIQSHSLKTNLARERDELRSENSPRKSAPSCGI